MTLVLRETIVEQVKDIASTMTGFTVERRVGDSSDLEEDIESLPIIVIRDDDLTVSRLMSGQEESILKVQFTFKWSTATSTVINTALASLKEKIYLDSTLSDITDFIKFRGDSKRRVSGHTYVSADAIVEITFTETVFSV